MVKKMQGINVNKLFPQNRKTGLEFRKDFKLPVSSLNKVWHQFQYVSYPDVAILRGSLCQTSKRFRPRTNGRQDAANCIVAIIFANIFKMSVWIPKFIDKILIIGDELLTLSITFKPRLRYEISKPKDLYNNVYIDDVKISYTTDGPTVSGKLYAENGHTDLETALKEYLETYEAALCTVLTMVVAFWKKSSAYYYFDPHERDEKGKAVRFRDGKACVMRFITVEQMVNSYFKNLDRSKNFTFTLFSINILRMAKVRINPPVVPERKIPLISPRDAAKKSSQKDSNASSSTSVDGKPVPPLEPNDKIKDVYEMNPEYVKFEDKYREQYQQLENIPETHITALSIEIKPHAAPSATYFQLTSSNTGILRGNTYKHSDLAPSVSLYCLGMLKIYKSRYWTKDIVNHILHYGHKLYKQSFYKQGSGGDRRVELKNVFKDIIIMGKRFTSEINHSAVIGVLNTVQEDQVDLQRGIVDFFREYDTGIIQGPIIVAIWQEADLYYMFDPCERSNNGHILHPIDNCEELPEGKACVTWFKLLDDLTKLYCDNVPKEKRFDPFFISNVIITDYVEVPLPWCNFLGVKPGKWILRGTFSQNNSRFADDNRNCQCTANAAIAITFRLLYIMEDWSTDIIDNILLEGDEFYSTTVQYLKDTKKFKHPFLMLDELMRSYTLLSISGKHNGKRINFDIRECLVNGVISASDDNAQTMNLKKGIIKFFTCYECGVVTAGNISVAIWKYNNYYYYFDSHSRDHKGVTHGIGTACVLRVENIEELVKSIETNLQPVPKDFFNIGYCEASIWETDESGLIKPPLNNYTRINETSAILRATHHEGDKLIYYENANKQTFSNCIAATAMMKIISPSLWTVMIMDEILKYGNLLHERAYLKVLENNPTFDENLTFNECEKAFRLGDYFITVEPDNTITSNFEVESENIILNTFTTYFRQDKSDVNKCAIFSSPSTTIACWMDLDIMYIFDPKEMDSEGISYDKDIWSDRQITPVESFMEYEGEGEMAEEQNEPEMMDENNNEEKQFVVEEESEYSNYSPINTEHPPGKAYVRWFTTLDTFAQHIIDNTPPNQLKTAEFILQPLKVTVKVIETEKPMPPEGSSIQAPQDADPAYVGPWYNFQEINYGMWIVRGTHCHSDLRYAETNRGNQDAAIAITFFILKHSIEIREFKSGLVDAVLKYGDKLHTYCLQKLKKSMMLENLDSKSISVALTNTKFEPYQIFKEFCLGQYIYKLKLDEKIITGDIMSSGEANPKISNDEPVKNLYGAIDSIMDKNYKNCILNVKNKSFAVYKGQKMYYLFDPNCRGPNGLKSTSGAACLIRCISLDQLIEVIKLNLPEEGSNRFYIDGVNIEKIPIKRGTKLGKKKIPESITEPTAYTTIEPGKIILTGTLSQEDERFNRGTNMQSSACALVALAMSEIHRTDTWTKNIVDEVIINGDRLYGATLDNVGFNFNPWEETMTVQMCNKDFYIGVNHVICEIIDEFDEYIMPLAKLHHGVERFFNSNLTHGVIQSNLLTAAIWKDSKFHYILYPNPMNSTGKIYPNGTACIMGFYSSDILSEQCLANIPRENYQEEFKIVPIAIHLINKKNRPNAEFYLTPSLDKQVFDNNGTKSRKRQNISKKSKKLSKYWIPLKEDSSILYAGFSQTSKVFIESSRGYQAAANAVISIVMFHLNEPSSWTQNTLNSILMSGDQLYKDSYLRYRPFDREIGLNMILRKFYIEKYCVEIVIYKATIVGSLNEIDISSGISNFFLYERAGVFIAFSMTLAMFQKGGQYYLFDPYGCELKGDINNYGKAILIRYKNLNNIANYLYKQFSTNNNNEKQYNIHAIQIKDIVYVP